METDRQRTMRRLGIYLVGVSIGLIFLGMVQVAKKRAIEQQRATNPAPVSAPLPAGGVTPK